MTDLNKKVTRKTHARIFERSQNREVIVTMEPPSLVGFRLRGTRRTYYLDAASMYMLALKEQIRKDEQEKRAARKASRKGGK